VTHATEKIAAGRRGYWLQVDGEQTEGLGLDRHRGGDQSEAVSVVEGGGYFIESASREIA
jgi:hypothetical protein